MEEIERDSSAYRAQKPPPWSPHSRVFARAEPIAVACVCELADGRAWAVASRADEYRRRAQQCLEMAAAFRDRDSRAALRHMAQAWLRLAEKNDFIPPVASEPTQPVVQQQQQIQPKRAQRGSGGKA
jgi:hypothetical protein